MSLQEVGVGTTPFTVLEQEKIPTYYKVAYIHRVQEIGKR